MELKQEHNDTATGQQSNHNRSLAHTELKKNCDDFAF